jgi:fumarate hydratase class II
MCIRDRGQVISGWVAQLDQALATVRAALPGLHELALGGTAVGTGLNTPDGFSARVIELISENTGLRLIEAPNHFEAQAAQDSLVETSGALRTVAVSLTKIANDLRWMGSGPRAGIGEISLPDLQPGSSIMPGKVNPVLPEATVMVAAQVIGNDAAITFAGAQGNFDLLVMLPVMARNLLESITLLGNVSTLLATRCVDGITANVERCRELAASSPSIVTPLNRLIGYEAAAKIAKHAVAEGLTIAEATRDLGYVERGELTEAELLAALDVAAMTGK